MNENVVIIEDDPGVRFFLEEALKGEKYSVSSFASYEEANNAIDRTTDLVIMDISLPGMDGLSATSDLKQKSDVPILIITAYGTKKKGGKGFGLFVSMRNIKLHGGNIKVESGDTGTTFTIELPFKGISKSAG